MVQLIWQYNNPIDIDKLKEAWSCAQVKFSSLRIRFAWKEELIQIIDKYGNLDWRYSDLSNEVDGIALEFKIKQLQEADRLERYSLEQGSLFRVYIIKQQEDLYTCIFSNHHAILDGWSNPILLNYIHEVYLKLNKGEKVSLSLDRSYEDTQKYLQEHEDDNKEYWKKYISQVVEHVDLSGLLERNNKNLRISDYKHITAPSEERLIIKDNLYYSLKKLSQEEGVTLNAILQYVWHKVLSVYGNSKQTIVGTTVSGRNLPIDNIENSVGLYINTLPLIIDHEQETTQSIIRAIKRVQDNINEFNSKSNVSLAKLQKGGRRLFDSLFVYENYPSVINEDQGSKLKIIFKQGIEKSDYPLGVTAYEGSDSLILNLEYASELFNNDSINHRLPIERKAEA